MIGNKQNILAKICYTELVYQRINKKLNSNFSKEQIEIFIDEIFIDEILKNTDEKNYIKTGKNYYVTNAKNNIRITINSNTFRVITVDKIKI